MIKYYDDFMKQRASFTFDKETIDKLKNLVREGKYRNLSHAAEEIIKRWVD